MATTDSHTEVDASPLTIDNTVSTTTRPTIKAIPQSSSLNEFQKRFPNVDLDLFSHYPLRRGRVGYCVIINEKHFDPSTGQNTRDGTDRDAESLSTTFTKLGFVVDRNDNVTLAQLNNIVKKYSGAGSEELHRECDMFAFCLLSHGEDGIFYTKDSSVKLELLFRMFRADHCRGLLGRPKLFFIQACRGNQFDGGVTHDAEADAKQDLKIPVESDFLIAYSVVPGFYSWRNNEDGSWFVQALTQVLEHFVVPYLRPDSVTTAEPLRGSTMEVDGGAFSCVKAPPESPKTPGRVAGAEQNNSATAAAEMPATPTSPNATAGVGVGGGSFAHPPPYHLQELMTLVSRIVAYSFESHTGNAGTDRMKQMPQMCSTLTHLLYFQHKYLVPSPAPLLAPVPQPRPTRAHH
jgi:hypothetical protein